MKKILFCLTIFAASLFILGAGSPSNNKSAFVDSIYMNLGPLSIQARDANYLGGWLKNNCETLFDSLKADYRDGSKPSGTTAVITDSVEIGDMVSVYGFLRSMTNGESDGVEARVNNAIRAFNNTFLKTKLDLIDSSYERSKRLRIDQGEFLLLRSKN